MELRVLLTTPEEIEEGQKFLARLRSGRDPLQVHDSQMRADLLSWGYTDFNVRGPLSPIYKEMWRVYKGGQRKRSAS